MTVWSELEMEGKTYSTELHAVLKDVKQALEVVRLKRSPTPEECVLSIGAERLEDERMRLEDELEKAKRPCERCSHASPSLPASPDDAKPRGGG